MTKEKRFNQQRIKVDPLLGITIDGMRLTEPRQTNLGKFQTKLEEPFFVGDNDLSVELRDVLFNPERFIQGEFNPLSTAQQDVSHEGTRTLKGVLRSQPKQIVVLSGLGVVKTLGNPPTKFIVEPPHWHESVDKYLEMGHMQVSR